jgi:SAM-dependent methyltransferase
MAKRRVKAFNIKNLYLIIADICHIPIRNGVVEATVSLGVLKHLPKNPYSTIEALNEIRRTIKKGGKVYVNDLPHLLHPDAWIYKTGIVFYKLLRLFTTGSYFYPPLYLERIINNLNAKDVVFSSYGYRLPLSSMISFIPWNSLILLLQKYFFISPNDEYRKARSQIINLKLLQLHLIEVTLTF